MNRHELDERLTLLKETETITINAVEVTTKAFDKLANDLIASDILQAEMLFTHLPMALTRIERGEDINEPPIEVVLEAIESGFYEQTKEQIKFIEQQWQNDLPVSEKNYLIIHYSVIYQSNKMEATK